MIYGILIDDKRMDLLLEALEEKPEHEELYSYIQNEKEQQDYLEYEYEQIRKRMKS